MKFDVVVGNPPYQETNSENNRDNPIYQYFYELASKISQKYILISPARFLSNVGQTSKSWNNKMLKDKHLKVLYFNQKSSNVFPNTDIKGGVAILYRDEQKECGEIGTFTNHQELNGIIKKANLPNFKSISDIIFVRSSYKFSNALLVEHPELRGRVKENEQKSMGSNVFDRYPEIFFLQKPDNGNYIQIYGRQNNERILKYVKSEFVRDGGNLKYWKVLVPKSNGSGKFGETLSSPVVMGPEVGHTQTFISFGKFKTETEAIALKKYLSTKFLRAMLGVKKITQDNATKDTWSKVPLEDFTSNSDIDWTKSIAKIDQQLYAKYNLGEDEIDFIEKKVKPME
ncbi:Eco57I restriction-modification methylase domain-containing protein [Enterococcus entomosocium]|uniref:Eco57I restriction-modification methylase domain-containing protein n=1 Tax=Enterococcus entomosocium TaxID=3034352 RepID=UPI002648AF0F|nr:Eco57I restriction-modification methylase domain-containing protein [Enterococcus entomosocium]